MLGMMRRKMEAAMKKFTQLSAAAIAAIVFSSGALADAANDASITSDVQSKLAVDTSLKGTAITVSTEDGVVSLSGNVNSDTQASTATQIAGSVSGTKDVDDSKLMVNGSAHPVSDAMITAKVKGMFIQQKLFGDQDIAAMSINIETNNGVVSLSGTADSQTEIDNAITIAKSVNGVKDVQSTVTINTANNE